MGYAIFLKYHYKVTLFGLERYSINISKEVLCYFYFPIFFNQATSFHTHWASPHVPWSFLLHSK